MSKNNVEIREATYSDRDAIINFFNEFDTPYLRDRAYWVWLNRIVTTDYSIVVIAEYEGNVIAHYAIVPLDMNVFGNKYRGGQGLNAVVSFKHRDKIQIYKVTKYAYDLARERGVDFMYAFPNKGYFQIQVRIEGCKLLTRLPSYKLNSRTCDELDLPFHVHYFGGSFEDFFVLDALVEYFNDVNSVSVHKNLTYYINRYIIHPQDLYKCFTIRKDDIVLGFVVFKFYDNPYTSEKSGHLVDFVLSKEISYEHVISLTSMSYPMNVPLSVKSICSLPKASIFLTEFFMFQGLMN